MNSPEPALSSLSISACAAKAALQIGLGSRRGEVTHRFSSTGMGSVQGVGQWGLRQGWEVVSTGEIKIFVQAAAEDSQW